MWISVCSAHRERDTDCQRCNTGHEVSLVVLILDMWFFRLAPGLWMWWNNRKRSKARQRIEELFPNLK